MTKSWLTKKDVARDLQVHVGSIPRLVAEGRLLPPVRLSSTLVRWDSREYAEWRAYLIRDRDQKLEPTA
jgi:predicted DNA-binding transcriptional regulator AlpA